MGVSETNRPWTARQKSDYDFMMNTCFHSSCTIYQFNQSSGTTPVFYVFLHRNIPGPEPKICLTTTDATMVSASIGLYEGAGEATAKPTTSAPSTQH